MRRGSPLRVVRRFAYSHPDVTFFGVAYLFAIILWLTQGRQEPWIGFVAVLAVTVFLLVRRIECRVERRHRAPQR